MDLTYKLQGNLDPCVGFKFCTTGQDSLTKTTGNKEKSNYVRTRNSINLLRLINFKPSPHLIESEFDPNSIFIELTRSTRLTTTRT